LDLLFAMLLLSFIWQQGVSHLKLNITLCVLEVVVPPNVGFFSVFTILSFMWDSGYGKV